MKYIITSNQYNLIMESSEDEKLLRVPELSFFANDWDILQAYLKSKGNPRYYVDGNLSLYGTKIKSLGNLIRVNGYLDVYNSNIESLGNLVRVEGELDLFGSTIESLGKLEYVGGDLNLDFSKIKSLGKLEYVGGDLYLKNTALSETTTEYKIRLKINVGGNIFIKKKK